MKSTEHLKIFKQWQEAMITTENPEDRVLYSAERNGKVEVHRFSKKELMSFRQCYTTDKKSKYFKARQQLPKYWFVSENGTLITCKKNVFLYVPTISGKTGRMREQCEVSASTKSWDGIHLDPAVIVNLVFGGKASRSARRALEKDGLMALRVVDLHHMKGYRYSNTTADIRKNRAYNCDLRRTKFLMKKEHYLITYAPTEDAPREKKIEFYKKLGELPMDGDGCRIMEVPGDGTGTILDNMIPAGSTEEGDLLMKSEDGDIVIIKKGSVKLEFAQIFEGWTPVLVDQNRRKLARGGKVLREEEYDEVIRIAIDFYNTYGKLPSEAILEKADGLEVFVEARERR